MKIMQFSVFVLITAVLLASCNQGSTSSDFSKQITELKSELLVLQIRVSALESGEATVSTEEEGYDIAKTKFGPFTVSCSGATPYLDGFKVKLRIGNLTNAKFNGAKLNICWGPRFDSEKIKYEEWSKNQKKKTINLTDSFTPGSFKDIEVALTPAKAEEIKFFTVGIELNQLALRVH
jgi:hypothetical protein